MKELNIEVIKEFNNNYDYGLSDKELRQILNEFRNSKRVSENDILDEFEYYVS